MEPCFNQIFCLMIDQKMQVNELRLNCHALPYVNTSTRLKQQYMKLAGRKVFLESFIYWGPVRDTSVMDVC